MHRLPSLSLLASSLLLSASLPAQTKVDLATQVKGQLPAANAQGIVNGITANAVSSISTSFASSLAPAGAVPPLSGTNGYTESFATDGHCMPGTSSYLGFDYSAGNTCGFPGFFHGRGGGAFFENDRVLAYGATNNQPPSPNHWAVGATDSFVGSPQNNFVFGMSNCMPGQWSCGVANEVGAFVNGSGFGYYVGSQAQTLWNTGTGTTSVVPGSTDSGFGGAWKAPFAGALYHVTLKSFGDGTLGMSVFPRTGVCYGGTCGAIYHLPITYPAGSIHQFFTRGNGDADFVGDVSSSDGVSIFGQPPAVDSPAPTPNGGGISGDRWALHADGTEWDYKTPASDLMNVWELYPPNYDPKKTYPWIIHFRGQENDIISLFGTFDNSGALDAALQGGFVVVSLDFHQTVPNSLCGGKPFCIYGGPQELADVAMAIKKVRSSTNLTAQPRAVADSAGGIILFNAITHGIFVPKSILCFSCNLGLESDAYGEGGMNNQMAAIQADYGFSNPTQYPGATSGFDPLLVVKNPGTAFPTNTGTIPLLPNAAQVASGIPMKFYADPSDPTVNTNLNSVAMCVAVNAVHPGNCTIDLSKGGGHVGVQEFPPIELYNVLSSTQ